MKNINIEEYLRDWIETQKHYLKASTLDDYDKIVRNLLIPAFGSLMLHEWKRKDIKNWLGLMTCGNKRMRNIQSVIRRALTDAIDEELIDYNFMNDFCYQKKDKPKEFDDIDPFTPDEQLSILEACPPELAPQFQFLLWTGLRTSEFIALDWAQIDFINQQVRVSKAITQASKGIAEPPKTKAGYRRVKLLQPAIDALNTQKNFSPKKGKVVFLNPETKERWTGDSPIRNHWKKILKKASVRYRRPYQTRHTYASMMLSAGENPMWVAQQMGHSNWTMIAKIYGRWMPSANTNAGQKAEKIFANRTYSSSQISNHQFI
ncbi:MAG: site-specific integrase [Alcaligenaceae bacterium]|nr:site-specific integrase [Alcaligenaceae bacterium]